MALWSPLTWLTLASAVGTGVALPPRAVAPSLDAALDAMEELTRALAGTLSAERLPLHELTVQVLKLVEKHDAKINQALTRLEALEARLGSLLAKHDA